MTMDPNNGRLLANRYELVELVGEGAMGRVYRAKDTLLGGVTVAVKFLSQTLLNQKMRERFEREATICALLGEKSIHIVRVRDYGVDAYNIPFYVMEFLNGESLSETIKFRPLSLKRFLNLTRQICLGLECAHKGIVFKGEVCPIIHRDIKPTNILVIQDSTLGELVKVLDFGIAKLIQASDSQTHSFMGTLAYCSPEQMEGKELDNRSDIYSLGVMMYEMLCGDMPLIPETSSFGGWYVVHHESEPRAFPGQLKLPQTLKKLVMKCLAKAPHERPQSIGEILQTLEAIQPDPNKSLIAVPKPPPPDFSDDEICYRVSWPEDKPLQKIVFPRLLRSRTGVLATLWIMLDYEDLLKRVSATRYNQFLFLTSPHPMLLWITVLHNRQHGPRWLPCYLDLKTSTGQKIARVLGDSGAYRILLFAMNEPQKCKNVMTSTIAPFQCKMLKEWANASQILSSSSQPQVSKKILKQEFEKLKPKIRLKLEAVHTNYPSNISG